MSENCSYQTTYVVDMQEQRRSEIVALAIECSNKEEVFPFPGIDPEAYAKIKRHEEEFPDCTTLVDDLLERFKSEGMKVVPGNDPESGNVFVIPPDSTNIENDSLLLRHLQLSDTLDAELKKLILLKKS